MKLLFPSWTSFLMLCVVTVQAQYFQFSQYNFTGQRINPATVAISDYASASFLYRHQPTDGGFSLNSNFLNASYPIIARNGTRWSGIGISFMDDRSGKQAIFQTQETALSYAVNVPIARGQTVSMGGKVLYQVKQLSMEGLYTGSQYIPDRGFDESIFNGEPDQTLKTNYVSLNLGLYWQQTDRQGNQLGYAGISFFDFNKPNDSFLEESNTLNSTAVASMGFTAYKKRNLSLLPEILYTQNSNTSLFNVGMITRYALTNKSKGFNDHVDVITKMIPGRSVILGLQLHRELFSCGFSYDMPAGNGQVANTGAFEVGVEIKKLVKKDPKVLAARRKNKQVSTRSEKSRQNGVTTSGVRKPQQVTSTKSDSVAIKQLTPARVIAPEETMSNRLKHKQDSLTALAQAGLIEHEPYVLEKATLYFNFEFNSADLDEESSRYLEDLSKALLDNPQLKIKLIGHTDNVGSDKFNLKLSLYRAQTIRDFIMSKGVQPERIFTDGKGLREPLNDNKTEEKREKNRRVELTILMEE